MEPKRYDFKPHTSGNTVNGYQVTMTLTSGGTTTPIDLSTISAIKMVFKKQGQDAVITTFELTTGLSVVDSPNGIWKVDAFTAFADPYLYQYKTEITYTSGVVKTYLVGDLPVIEEDL